MVRLSKILDSILIENPDTVRAREFMDLGFEDKDAISFTEKYGKIYLAPHWGELSTHSRISSFYKSLKSEFPNELLNVKKYNDITLKELLYDRKYDGRVWAHCRLISFWKYPETQEKLNEIIQNIKEEWKTIVKIVSNGSFVKYIGPELTISYIEVLLNADYKIIIDREEVGDEGKDKTIGIDEYHNYL